MVEGGRTSLRVYTGLPGIPYNTRRTPKNEAPKSLKDMLKPQWKGKIASTPYVTSLNILAAKEMWGKEAALEYVRQLSKQVVGLIRCNEIERVASGEFLAFVWIVPAPRLLRPKLTALPWNTLSRSMARCSGIAC